MHKVIQDIYRRGDLIACLGCAVDRSSGARVAREFDEMTEGAFCDFCGSPLTCELGADGRPV